MRTPAQLEIPIEKSWKKALADTLSSKDFRELMHYLEIQYSEKEIYPEYRNIFRALNLTPLDKVRIVIVGQDPYPREGEADGLCFSVNKGFGVPAGLKNIFKEIRDEFGRDSSSLTHSKGSLERWADKGVLLLNSVLTVEKGKPNSHKNIGWEAFTDEVISSLSRRGGVVFMLWGAKAKRKEPLIDRSLNLVLEANHPSQPSRSGVFAGNGHFGKANEWLKEHGKTEIDW